MRAAVWLRQTMLTSFYLRDVTHRDLDTFSLSPVVAAQQVLHPQTDRKASGPVGPSAFTGTRNG